MSQKYIHYFGNESSESLLEAYGIIPPGISLALLFSPLLFPEKSSKIGHFMGRRSRKTENEITTTNIVELV